MFEVKVHLGLVSSRWQLVRVTLISTAWKELFLANEGSEFPDRPSVFRRWYGVQVTSLRCHSTVYILCGGVVHKELRTIIIHSVLSIWYLVWHATYEVGTHMPCLLAPERK